MPGGSCIDQCGRATCAPVSKPPQADPSQQLAQGKLAPGKLAKEKLAEEFAPTGPKLSRFPIQPAPPVRQRLFADEARFALRLALLVGGTELAAWASIARLRSASAPAPWLFGLVALRLLRPLWAKAGTLAPRPLIAFVLLGVALALQGAAFMLPIAPLVLIAACAAGLPALGDLAASCIADSVTVERRAAAYSWLDIGQSLGCALGLALGALEPRLVPLGAALALLCAGMGVPDLHDRGTPRSNWPLRSYLEVLRSPLPQKLALAALFGAGCAVAALARGASPWSLLALLLALLVAARLEPSMRNPSVLPQLLAALSGLSLVFKALALPALGTLVAALAASVARGAAELERPLASSLVWSALALGAGLAALAPFAW